MIRGGYGQLNDRGTLLKAHRISYELHFGKIPEGLFICHKCNTPPCCNPRHLYAGTPKENWDDTKKAGTRFVPDGAKGEKHHSSKLTEKDVLFIRKSKIQNIILAEKFNVSRNTISHIKKGKTWKKII